MAASHPYLHPYARLSIWRSHADINQAWRTCFLILVSSLESSASIVCLMSPRNCINLSLFTIGCDYEQAA